MQQFSLVQFGSGHTHTAAVRRIMQIGRLVSNLLKLTHRLCHYVRCTQECVLKLKVRKRRRRNQQRKRKGREKPKEQNTRQTQEKAKRQREIQGTYGYFVTSVLCPGLLWLSPIIFISLHVSADREVNLIYFLHCPKRSRRCTTGPSAYWTYVRALECSLVSRC